MTFDFLTISSREAKGGVIEVFPDFMVGRFNDLMIRAHSFYAIWDEERGLWSTDEYDVQRLVDEEMRKYAEESGGNVKYLRNSGNRAWSNFQQHVNNLPDHYHQLDQSLTFANQKVKKNDYVSRRLSYSLEPGDHSAWDEMVGTLYSVEEREKIEWAIGAVVSGDTKKIQKFLVFYGLPGSGKGTILNIILKLFEGYSTTFDAKALGSSNGNFATEAFKSNPLIAVQHDGDLSRIEDNTRLNSIISHEDMPMNEKYKPGYTSRVNAFLFMGTNQPVKISDAKSGIIRRLIDVHPTGVTIPRKHYDALMAKIDFELGAIAHHCLGVYRTMGKNHYSSYRPTEMMLQTDVFFNFIEAHYDVFKKQDGASLKQAYLLYKEWCVDSGIDKPLPQYKFREELRNYFDDFLDRTEVDGEVVRSYYCGFNANKYKAPSKNVKTFALVMDDTVSLFDQELADAPAQYAKHNGVPTKYWTDAPRTVNGQTRIPKPSQIVSTTLADIDTSLEHFVKVPTQHIVIDFDLRDESGEKSLERNLEAASAWPPTYAEISKSGNGVHLHYDYDGDVGMLRPDFSEGIEVKVFVGNASLRRKLTRCNNVPVASMVNTLPIKEKPVLGVDTIKDEKHLRAMLAKNIRREIHPGTKPSIDFIKKLLDDSFESGVTYDVTDMRPQIIAFAGGSTNHSLDCIKMTQQMKFRSADKEPPVPEFSTTKLQKGTDDDDRRLVFFDVEVYPNLFVICWKYEGDASPVRMINPSAQDVEKLLSMKLVGFYNRRYDNHIIYAAYMGYDNEALFALSQKIIGGNAGAMFGEAYNLSYTDIWDFSSVKQSLKKFQIDLGLKHVEMNIPWDQPVPDDMIDKVVEYCVNDVLTTEQTFNARKQDFVARQILASLSGLSVNDPTNKHTAKIIFGNDRNAKDSFVYTDLSEMFPGYTFEMGSSHYKSRFAPEESEPVHVGEGGYVYADEGMYEDVAVLDVASMHPTSIIALNAFGPYTPNFKALLDARLAIKRGKYDEAKTLMGGKLAPYLTDEGEAKALAYALKIVINIVYGMTAAKFDNPFRIPNNRDNIVAKRGALFMIDLKNAVEARGFLVVHIKTDSIKIPGATPEIIKFVEEFGAEYGYEFEHETTYNAFCLVNDAVYVAREGKGDGANFSATGAQFQHPYVFKSLFSEDDISFDDYCETKQVGGKGTIYIDHSGIEKPQPEDIQKMTFIGKIGRFVPVVKSSPMAGKLWRVAEERFFAVTGTKEHYWAEASVLQTVGSLDDIDMDYFDALVDKARKDIEFYGPFEWFCNG